MNRGELFDPQTSNLHEVMAGYVERGEVPGLVAAISREGHVDVDVIGTQAIDGPPMARDTIFRIASMTKPVIAAATMMLTEDSTIRLDDPVHDVLPELADRRVLTRVDGALDDTVPAKRAITVRDLLTFRWGFGIVLAPPDMYPIQRAMSALELGQGPPTPSIPPDPDEWMRRLGTLPLMHQPGQAWMYNTGSDVLGVLIARAAGKPLETFLSERIFRPLGMRDTSFSVPPSKIERLATSYGIDSETGAFEIYDPPEGGQWSRPPTFPSGAGGLVSTIDDYLAFAGILLNGGEHGGEHILSRPSIEMMSTNQLTAEQQASGQPILERNQGWGFGVAVVTGPGNVPVPVGSYGWNGGLGTTWLNDPAERSSLVLLTQVNWTSASHPAVSRDFLTAAFQANERW